MKEYVDVDVVCANFNNALFLRDFFNSACKASVLPRRLIFVDDGSTDESVNIALEYAGENSFIEVIELPKNVGFGNALNEGIRRSSSKYIARMDPDDIFISNRLEVQYSFLEENSEVDVVGSNAEIFQSETGKISGVTNFPSNNAEINRRIRVGEHGVLHPTVMVRAELYRQHLYVQENVPAEDYDVFARMAASGARFSNIKKPMIRYRVHSNSVSNNVPFETIRKTFHLRDVIFSTKTPWWKVRLYHFHILSYRRYLFSKWMPSRVFFGAVAAFLYPQKLVSRLYRNITQ